VIVYLAGLCGCSDIKNGLRHKNNYYFRPNTKYPEKENPRKPVIYFKRIWCSGGNYAK
jgi:hypothetical protein